MAESRADPALNSKLDKEGKAHNVLERAKEEFEGFLHSEKKKHHHNHHKETHGLRDIDEATPISDVKAPNVFERAKEEFEALVETLHQKKEKEKSDSTFHSESRDSDGILELKSNEASSIPEKDAKEPTCVKLSKEGLMHKGDSPHHHHKETHGMSDDIDENTPIDEVKGPNVFARAKEEFEAVIHAIHPKKESSGAISSPKKEGGLRMSIEKGLQKICSPRGHNRD